MTAQPLSRTHPDQHAEQQGREEAITRQAVDSFATSDDERFRAVMQSLVEHLHGFIRDVRLTEAGGRTPAAAAA